MAGLLDLLARGSSFRPRDVVRLLQAHMLEPTAHLARFAFFLQEDAAAAVRLRRLRARGGLPGVVPRTSCAC